MMVAWGTIVTLQGIMQGYRGLLATRVMLGVAESGFFPAATYLVTTCTFEPTNVFSCWRWKRLEE